MAAQPPPPPQYAPPPHAPPPYAWAPPVNRDEEHVRLLGTFHYVLAGIMGLLGSMPLIHVTIGLLMLSGEGPFQNSRGGPPPEFVGWMFLIIGSVGVLGAWTFVILLIVAGKCLRRKIRRTFCLVVAGISCVFMPMGTVLGVFTIIVLARPTVKLLFDGEGTG